MDFELRQIGTHFAIINTYMDAPHQKSSSSPMNDVQLDKYLPYSKRKLDAVGN